MIKTIKELLIEWWAGNTTTKMPIPTIYTYEVKVDDRLIHIESMSRSRMYVHYKADVCSLQGEEEISKRQVHPSSQSKETILTERSITALDD